MFLVLHYSRLIYCQYKGPNPEFAGLGTLFAVKAWKTGGIFTTLKPFFQLYQFVQSVFTTVKDCGGDTSTWQGRGDCFYAATDLMANTVTGLYEVSDYFTATKARRDDISLLDGRPYYGNSTIKYTQDSSGAGVHVYSIAHIPHNGSLILASLESKSASLSANYTWEHHASFYVNNAKVANLWHRLAHPDDLGAENDGTIHQYRVQGNLTDHPSPESSVALNRKRSTNAEKRYLGDTFGPFNLEFIYENNNDQGAWQQWSGSGQNLGDKWAEKFEYHNVEAGCASPGFCVSLYGTTTCSTTMKAMLAYGWNYANFNWQGNSKSWLDQCGTVCDMSTSSGGVPQCPPLTGGNGV